MPVLPPPSKDLAQAILGLWRLISREDYDRDGRRYMDPIMGARPLGVLSFAPGYFAAQFMNPDRSVTSPQSLPPTGANNSSAINGYDAGEGLTIRLATTSVDGTAVTRTLLFERAG